MKAFFIDKYGTNETLKFGDIKKPEIGEYDVLIRVYSASVNPLDLKIQDGSLKVLLPYKFPIILGNDFSGVVENIGKNVKKFKIGDEVYGKTEQARTGSFSEFLSIKETYLAKIPRNLTMEESASIPLVGLTAWQVLVERAKLKKGQKVFIQAGSGGVGSVAIQLAKYLGATVATTTGTENIEWVKNLGADIVIDYRKEKFEEVLRDYDIVLDTLGGEFLEKSIKIVKSGGKIISLAGPPDYQLAKEMNLSFVVKMAMYFISYKIKKMAKKNNVDYSFLFMKSNGHQLEQLNFLIESGKISPIIDRIFPFAQTNDALNYVKKGHSKGKVVIKVK
ncbi:MAG: NADP-dependent oxidoreductase [Fusobacteriaceae bacterium]|nr:NADP-dependent oxidoreductase [Fusobacteriaceae bacterium]